MTRKVILALLLSAGACAPAGNAQPQEPRTLEIHNFEFAPARIEAHLGDTIEFTNLDFAPHTATDDASKWDTKQISYGKSASIVITTAGYFAYHCRFHPQMKGMLVVSEGR